MEAVTVSVIIPVLNAADTIAPLLGALNAQSRRPDEIRIVDSSSDDGTATLCAAYPGVSVTVIPREEFDHASTRDAAIRACGGEICVLLTQDALPADERLIEKLIAPLSDPTVCMAYGRHLPKTNASHAEKLIRSINYPEQSAVRSREDIPALGVKTFFFSDACAAYRKSDYLALGGFEPGLPANEDMLFAAKAINAGYKTAYAADACVFHSHDFSLHELYRRYRTQAMAIETHKELLRNVPVTSEGARLFKAVTEGLFRQGRIFSWLSFCADCAARFLGHRAGVRAARRRRK